jgi:hypothetical protein
MGAIALASVTVPNEEAGGWRGYLGFSAVPMMLCLLAFIYLPESPRWLLSAGYDEQAMEVLRAMGSENGVWKRPTDNCSGSDERGDENGDESGDSSGGNDSHESIGTESTGTGTSTDSSENRNGDGGETKHLLLLESTTLQAAPCAHGTLSMAALFGTPMLRRTTLLLWVVWFSGAVCYYGFVLMLSYDIFPAVVANSTGMENATAADAPIVFQYRKLFVSAAAEVSTVY